MANYRISVVTPTFRRPVEIRQLLETLADQTTLPAEVIVVDGAPVVEKESENVITDIRQSLPFEVHYIRHGGGTALQRNVGIDSAQGDLVALVDDDVRLESNFLQIVCSVFDQDRDGEVGGIVGYRTNQHFSIEQSARWRWYRRLRLLTEYEPGRYDYDCGYPINNNLQTPFSGTRSVDFMTTACAVWRRAVFESGLRFDPFFADYGVLEDAHFSLRAGRRWKLLQCGDAKCEELHSPNGRVDRRRRGFKSVVNYHFVFQDIAGPLRFAQQFRFWRYQAFELVRIGASALRRWNGGDIQDIRGRLDGILHIFTAQTAGRREVAKATDPQIPG